MKLKSTVRFKNPALAVAVMNQVVESVFRGHGLECIITSGNDSSHMDGSLHYSDRALDYRTKHILDKEVKHKIVTEIKDALTVDYDVILEFEGGDNEHLHIEWQPKHL